MTIKERIAVLQELTNIIDSLNSSIEFISRNNEDVENPDNWQYNSYMGSKLLVPMLEKLAEKV